MAARAAVRVAARALLGILKPICPPPFHPRPGRLARLNLSLLKAFGELFDIDPMTPAVDVNGRFVSDVSRLPLRDLQGIWDGPTTSRTPHARGALQDDNAHNWNASYPSANFDDEPRSSACGRATGSPANWMGRSTRWRAWCRTGSGGPRCSYRSVSGLTESPHRSPYC